MIPKEQHNSFLKSIGVRREMFLVLVGNLILSLASRAKVNLVLKEKLPTRIFGI